MTSLRDFVPEDWPYIHARTNAIACFDTCGVVAYDEETGKRFGAVVFDQLSPNAAQCHIVITHPVRALRAYLLQGAADYIFEHRGKSVIFGFIPASNDKSLNFAQAVGFRELVRLQDGYKQGVDVVVFEMRKDDCRWLLPTYQPVNLHELKRVS